MEPEDVVNVLDNMVGAVKSGGLVLDLQAIRLNPNEPVYQHNFGTLEDFAGKDRRLPSDAVPGLRALTQACVVRERCRLRRLRVR